MRTHKTIVTRKNHKLPSASVHAVMTAYRVVVQGRRYAAAAQLRAENPDLALLFDLEDLRADKRAGVVCAVP